MTLTLSYDRGSIVIAGVSPQDLPQLGKHFKWDERTKCWRAEGQAYRPVVMALTEAKLSFVDKARSYKKLPIAWRKRFEPRPHQAAALAAWEHAGRRGVVQLPTGAGKTFLALLAMATASRPTLVVVPTIDLVQQWSEVIEEFLLVKVGCFGGGLRQVESVTVSTYDSAVLTIEQLSNRFGLIVFDECHHLPSPSYQAIARASLAPFRLGLSATVERPDGNESIIYELLGDLVYEGRIDEMVTTVLAPYDVVSIEVELTVRERQEYTEARNRYLGFVRRHRINFGASDGWQQFIRLSSRLPGGKEAMESFRLQKKLAQGSEAKLVELWQIIRRHPGECMIVFTEDNAMAYKIGRNFFLPVLTHQTKLKERRKMLASLQTGDLTVLVTSKVLNEGVDVPKARIGVVISGSGAVREHVQRLGRILRHQPGKKAVLYELIAKHTGERYVNQRRRQHHAYQRPSKSSL